MVSIFSVPASTATVSTSTEGSMIAGSAFFITCVVTKPAALLAAPDITWINPSGVEISGQINTTQMGSTTLVSSALQLNPLLVSHSGLYTCQVSLSSPSLLAPLNLTSIATVSIQSKLETLYQ